MPSLPESSSLVRSNQAVNINPPTGTDLHISSHGSDWLWTAFCLFILFAIIHGLFFVVKGKKAIGHVAALITSAMLAFTYFTLAADLGWSKTKVEFSHFEVQDPLNPGELYRQVFYARYIGWFLAWPVLLFLFEFVSHSLDLSNFSADSLASYLLELAGAEVFVVGLLIAILISNTYKWGYFTFSTASFLATAAFINYNGFVNDELGALLKLALGVFDVVWLLYPVAFGLSEGGNRIHPDAEQVFYGVLDLVMFLIIPLIFAIQADQDQKEAKSTATHTQEAKKITPKIPRSSGETTA